MKPDPTNGRPPVNLRKLKRSGPNTPMETLDALAIELGRIAAERDFAAFAQDKPKTDGLSSSEGRTP